MSDKFLDNIYFLTSLKDKSKKSKLRLELTGKEAYSFSHIRKILLEQPNKFMVQKIDKVT